MGDLSSATIGTKVRIPRTYSGGFDIDTVTRVTSSQVCCGNTRLRKDDGLVVGSGDSWHRRYANIATDSDILQYRIACATSKLRNITVTAENVDVIEALLRGEPVKNNETLEQLAYRLLGKAWPDDLMRPTFEQSLDDPYFKNVCKVVRLAQEEALLRK